MNVTREIAGGTNTRRVGSPRHTERATAVRIRNDLATPVSGAVVLSLSACDGVTVTGGSREWIRTDGGVTEVKVAYEVPAESETTVRTDCRSARPPRLR